MRRAWDAWHCIRTGRINRSFGWSSNCRWYLVFVPRERYRNLPVTSTKYYALCTNPTNNSMIAYSKLFRVIRKLVFWHVSDTLWPSRRSKTCSGCDFSPWRCSRTIFEENSRKNVAMTIVHIKIIITWNLLAPTCCHTGSYTNLADSWVKFWKWFSLAILMET